MRRTLQQYGIFYQEEKGSGIWYLREEKPLEEFDPKKNPNRGHEDVQGMLFELGKIYGYEIRGELMILRVSENFI